MPEIIVHLIIGALVVTLGLCLRNKFAGQGHGTTKKSVSTLSTALRDERMISSIIVNTIEDGVILLDGEGIIRSFNPGAVSITGWKETEALTLEHRSVVNLVDDKNQPYENESNPFVQVYEQKKTIRDNNASLVSRAGKNIPVSMHISPLLGDDDKVIGAVAVFRDVTQERAEENQRAEFISTASHEMRTPVAAIEGYLSLALNDRVSTIDTRARDFLEKAHRSTQHLGRLFQDLLTSAKAEDGRLSNHPVVVEMGELLQQLTEDLKFTAEKKGLTAEYTVGSNSVINASADGGKMVKPLYYVHADPDRLREVITDLFDNAVKYTESGKISVGLTGSTAVVQFFVKDTGPGISAEDLPHLFQKFYRVDNSATRTVGGTGLGLFICRKIVELYQGKIWAESEVGKGSGFYINLPRLSTQQAADLQSAEAGSHVLPDITSLSKS